MSEVALSSINVTSFRIHPRTQAQQTHEGHTHVQRSLDNIRHESLLEGPATPRSRTAVQGYLAHKNCTPPGPYSRTMPRVLCWPLGGGMFLMSEVHLYIESARAT